MTKSELLSRISSAEITEWMAYYDLEPFGEKRADLRSAIVSKVIADANSEKNKSFDVDDFMPQFREERQSVAEQENLVRNLQKMFGGNLKENDG